MKPRTQRPPISDSEMRVIDAIVNRVQVIFPDRSTRSIKMDLMTTHLINPLELDMLLNADDNNFVHDIAGIERHLDRRTLTLTGAFSPRFSKCYHSERKVQS